MRKGSRKRELFLSSALPPPRLAPLLRPCPMQTSRVASHSATVNRGRVAPVSGRVCVGATGGAAQKRFMKKEQDKEPHRFAARLAHKAPQRGAFFCPNSAPEFAEQQDFRTATEPQRRKMPVFHGLGAIQKRCKTERRAK